MASSGTLRGFFIIHNPVAGGRSHRLLAATIARLQQAGHRVRLHETARRGDAELSAATAELAAGEALVIAGGDGTINEAVNGLARRDALPLIGIIPIGTTNVLARELGLRRDAAKLAALLAGERTLPIHPGIANGRHFCTMASAGIDARIVASVNLALKERIGQGAYLVEAVRQLWTYRPLAYRVTIGAEEWRAASVIVGKARYYAGPFICAPGACAGEPVLHVCLFLAPGRWAALRYGMALITGTLPRRKDYRVVPATRVTIAAPEGEPVECDGDIATALPAEFALAPRALQVLVES